MQVRAVMSTPAITVDVDSTLHDAIGIMLEHRVGSVLVVDTAIVGILTRSDVLRAAYHAGDSLAKLPVTKGMSADVVTTSPSRSIDLALETMQSEHIKKLPVVEDFDLVGIITLTDIALHQPERVRELQQTLDRRDDWTD